MSSSITNSADFSTSDLVIKASTLKPKVHKSVARSAMTANSRVMLREVICFVVLLTASFLQLAVGSPSDRGEIVSTADGRIRAVRRRNDADFVLGGLFPVHDNDEDGSRCGEVRKERGVERMEAMLYYHQKRRT